MAKSGGVNAALDNSKACVIGARGFHNAVHVLLRVRSCSCLHNGDQACSRRKKPFASSYVGLGEPECWQPLCQAIAKQIRILENRLDKAARRQLTQSCLVQPLQLQMPNRACRSSMKPLPPIARCASSKRLRSCLVLTSWHVARCRRARGAAASRPDTTISWLGKLMRIGLSAPRAKSHHFPSHGIRTNQEVPRHIPCQVNQVLGFSESPAWR